MEEEEEEEEERKGGGGREGEEEGRKDRTTPTHFDQLDCLLSLEHARCLHGSKSIQNDGSGPKILAKGERDLYREKSCFLITTSADSSTPLTNSSTV